MAIKLRKNLFFSGPKMLCGQRRGHSLGRREPPLSQLRQGSDSGCARVPHRMVWIRRLSPSSKLGVSFPGS